MYNISLIGIVTMSPPHNEYIIIKIYNNNNNNNLNFWGKAEHGGPSMLLSQLFGRQR
jgi:hypothetical protein